MYNDAAVEGCVTVKYGISEPIVIPLLDDEVTVRTLISHPIIAGRWELGDNLAFSVNGIPYNMSDTLVSGDILVISQAVNGKN